MRDVVGLETADDMSNRMSLANIAEKLVTKPLAFGCAGDQTGDVTEDYEGDFSPEHVAAAAQVAADRIEALMFERVAAEELKPTWLTAAEIETAAVNATNVYSGGRS